MTDNLPDSVSIVPNGASVPTLSEGDRERLRLDVLPAFLRKQRWFAKDRLPTACQLVYAAALQDAEGCFIAEFEVTSDSHTARYFLPLALVWSESNHALAEQFVITAVQQSERRGIAIDAFAAPAFAHALLKNMRAGATLTAHANTGPISLVFSAQPGLEALSSSTDAPVKLFLGEQSNSSMTIGGDIMLKLVRHVSEGVHPEAEMTRRLTQVGYANCAALLGELTRQDATGAQATLALAHANIPNQGDAWSWTRDYLEDFLTAARSGTVPQAGIGLDLDGYTTVASAIGRRLGELHAALALPTDDPAFAPELTRADDAQAWADDIILMLNRARSALMSAQPEGDAALAREVVLAAGDALDQAIRRLAGQLEGTLRIRIHGDFHLGQVLIAQNDAYLIDFEGEPARTLDERRRKATPLRDVAGLLRSFDYARAAFLESDLSQDDSTPPVAANDVSLPSAQTTLYEQFPETAGSAFLNAYRNVASTAPHPWITPSRLDALLPLALLEKAAYEVVYEASHRPNWLRIPLAGLSDLVADILAADPHSTSTP